jgi:putative transposase
VSLADAGHRNTEISRQLSIQEENAGKWRKRWLSGSAQLIACEGKPKALRDAIESLLADAPRPGIAPVFTAEQVCQIIALACELPPTHLSHWTRAALVEAAVKRGIVEQISCTTIGRFLKSGTDKTASITLLAES